MFEAYREAVGRPRSQVSTPALLLDIDVVRRNMGVMSRRLGASVGLRPHFKSHKCMEIARLQLDGGAIGMTTATGWEAAALAKRGVREILIANEVVGQDKVQALADAAGIANVMVAVDDPGNAQALSSAAARAGCEIGVLIDIDVGMGRCGVRTEEHAKALAERIGRLPGLRLWGVMGYEGHCVLETDRAVRADKANAATQRLLQFRDCLRGIGCDSEVVSAGGTGTFDLTGVAAGVTEIQAGSYIFTDATRRKVVPEFESGLTVLATVVSRHGDVFVLDAGKKTIGIDFTLPQLVGGAGTVRAVAEEHMICDAGPGCGTRIGDTVEAIPGYAPVTVNLHDVYHVVEGGIVVDIWPILARGAGRGEAV